MGLTFADVDINGRRYRALIDMGFNGEVVVSRKVAEELGLKPAGESGATGLIGDRIYATNAGGPSVT